MIRTGITYRFKQRVTEAGIFPGFFMGPSWKMKHWGYERTKKTHVAYFAMQLIIIAF